MAPPTPYNTTLSERIARLNLEQANASSSSSSAPTSTPKPGYTGASIQSKLAQFQKNAEDAPLIPVGSFGLAGARRDPPGSRERGAEKGRVASLGGGRAAVPLGPLKTTPRSVSAGSQPRSTDASETASDAGSPVSSRASSQYGGSAVVVEDPKAEEPRPTPVRGESHLSIASGMMTPGSVSSMNVETGSLSSEAGPDPSSIKLGDIDLNPSPLSSPVLTALVDSEPTISPPPADDDTDNFASESLAPPSALRHLEGLKTPKRSESTVSVSSMLVEAGSVVGDEAAPDLATPTGEADAEEKAFPTTVGSSDDGTRSGVETPHDTEEALASREQRTRQELDRYEGETTDPTAPPTNVVEESDSERPSTPTADRPVLSTWSIGESPRQPQGNASFSGTEVDETAAHDEDAGAYDDILDDFAEDSSRPCSVAGGLPKVNCSDCHEEVDLLQLADHSCASTHAPPALAVARRESPKSPVAELSSLPSQSDLSETSTVEATDTPSQPSSPEPSSPVVKRQLSTIASDAASEPASEPIVRSESQRSAKLDSFIPQTESIVPEDVDLLEDDDDFSAPPPPSSFAAPAVPSDILDDYVDDLDIPSSPSPLARPPPPTIDLPEDVGQESEEKEDIDNLAVLARPRFSPSRSLNKSSRATKSQSVYERVGGSLFDSDEEDVGYEGGSVSIVSRTTASHGAAQGMTRTRSSGL